MKGCAVHETLRPMTIEMFRDDATLHEVNTGPLLRSCELDKILSNLTLLNKFI